jgi:uncharacterized membrane protein YtjA (UPF0391 family)
MTSSVVALGLQLSTPGRRLCCTRQKLKQRTGTIGALARCDDDVIRPLRADNQIRRLAMLGWALTFLVIALIAAVLGFGGIAGFAVELAKIVFFVAIVLFVLSAIFGFVRGRSPTL